MRLLTRREVVNTWLKQPDKLLDSKCCPSCRDILNEYENSYACVNDSCTIGIIIKE